MGIEAQEVTITLIKSIPWVVCNSHKDIYWQLFVPVSNASVIVGPIGPSSMQEGPTHESLSVPRTVHTLQSLLISICEFPWSSGIYLHSSSHSYRIISIMFNVEVTSDVKDWQLLLVVAVSSA